MGGTAAGIALLALGVALALGSPASTLAAMAPSLFVSPDGNDASSCTQSSPCRTVNRAYQAASCSSVIQVAAGTYTDATLLDYDPRKDTCTQSVTFIPSGAVAFGSVAVSGARHWEFNAARGGSFSFGEVTIMWQPSNTNLPVVDGTFDGGASRDIHFRAITSATADPQPKQQFKVLNSEIGPNFGTTEDLIHLRNVRDTLFRGNFIHDLTKSHPGDHSDCIQSMGSSTNLSFTGNRFQNCWSEALLEKADFGPDVNIRFTNNQIDHPINGDGTTGYAVGFFGAPFGSRVTGELRHNCVRATSNNHLVVNHTTVDAGAKTVTDGGDNVVVAGNVYGGCAIPLAPEREITPGALSRAVRPDTISRTICKPGWIGKTRPAPGYLRKLKAQQLTLYGATAAPSAYVLDYLIPLALGGAPRSPKNVWPELRRLTPRSATLERKLRARLCSGRITLARAQATIRAFKFASG